MRVIKKVLHEKRKTTEAHIQHLQQAGKQGVRYTAMMPDIPFLMLGLISDIGWMIHLIAGVSSVLVWLIAGGVLNFVAGLSIYLSFKKGIFYGGVQ